MGRSVITLLVMVVAFGVLSAFFVAIDSASGVQVPVHLSAADTTRTRTPTSAAIPSTIAAPTPRHSHDVSPTAAAAAGSTAATTGAIPTGTALPLATSTPPATAASSGPSGATATGSAGPASPTGAETPTATVFPTPPGGVTPPRYGTQPNYPNNTSFTAAFMQELDERIIALTNQQRAAHGLAALTEDPLLDVIAASRSEDLIKRDYFDHYDPTGPVDASGHHVAAVQELLTRNGVSYTEVGENLISNTGYPLDATTPQQVVTAWMNHPEHRANILHPTYTSIGVGMAAENEPQGLRVVVTQVFLR